MNLDGVLRGDYAACYKAATAICSILCDICNCRPSRPLSYLEFCQPFLAPFIHGLSMDQHRSRTRFPDMILRHLVEWRGWLAALCSAAVVAVEASSGVGSRVMEDLCTLHIQLFRCRRHNAEMAARYRLSGSCKWILSTVWSWAIEAGMMTDVIQITAILDQVHQCAPNERDATPIETLLSGTCAIMHWLDDDSDTFRDFTILASFVLHARHPLGHLLLINGFFPLFCRSLYSHISRLPTDPSLSHFRMFKVSFAVLRHSVEITGPDFLAQTAKVLIPCIWFLVKWSTLYNVPAEVKEEGVSLLERVTGMTVYYSVLRDIDRRYVRRHRFETRFPDVRNPDSLQQAWIKLCSTLHSHEDLRKEFLRIPQAGCLNVCASLFFYFSFFLKKKKSPNRCRSVFEITASD
jgi:hypothetical protein